MYKRGKFMEELLNEEPSWFRKSRESTQDTFNPSDISRYTKYLADDRDSIMHRDPTYDPLGGY